MPVEFAVSPGRMELNFRNYLCLDVELAGNRSGGRSVAKATGMVTGPMGRKQLVF
jgi:hypothetical protein